MNTTITNHFTALFDNTPFTMNAEGILQYKILHAQHTGNYPFFFILSYHNRYKLEDQARKDIRFAVSMDNSLKVHGVPIYGSTGLTDKQLISVSASGFSKTMIKAKECIEIISEIWLQKSRFIKGLMGIHPSFLLLSCHDKDDLFNYLLYHPELSVSNVFSASANYNNLMLLGMKVLDCIEMEEKTFILC